MDKLILQYKAEFYMEIPNPIENQLKKGYEKINEILKSLSNYNDMIGKLEDYAKIDINCYRLIVSGLLHGILFDHKRSNELFQYLFVINKDNFESFLLTLFAVIEENHLKLTNSHYFQIFIMFDKLIQMNNPKLVDLMIILLRVFFVGRWINERIDLYKIFLEFIINKFDWIFTNTNQYLAGLIFIKVLRLISENHFISQSNIQNKETYKEILKSELIIINKLWNNKRENILQIGKELIRNIIPLSKANIPEINTIIEDIAKTSSDNLSLYIKLLDSPQIFTGFNPYVHIQIPPLLERMLIFIMTEVKRQNYAKYVNWIIKKFSIFSDSEFSLFVDITRYIITCYSYLSIKNKTDYTPRWIMLGFILKSCRNEVLSGEIKQAIFFDWINFKKEKDNFYIIEPGLSIIFNSIRDFPNLTMELIEFIFVYSENFDPSRKKIILNCVTEAFKSAETFQMFQLKKFFNENNINEDIKKIFEILIQFKKDEDIINFNEREESFMNISNDSIDINDINDNKENFNLISVNKTKFVETEIFIHPLLDELIDPIALKNFLNYKNKLSFKNLLEYICKKFIDKIKSNNMFDSKLMQLQSNYNNIYKSFADFYLNIFKEELINEIIIIESNSDIDEIKNKNILNENEENTKTSFNTNLNNISDKNINPSNTTNISHVIIEFLILKSFEKNEKELNFIIEIIKCILDKFPNFIVKIIFQFSLKYTLTKNSKTYDNLFLIFSKLFDNNLTIIKEKINQFFNICVDYLDMEIINFFLTKGFPIFNHIFTDDPELIFNLIQYGNNDTQIKIISDINLNKYSLIEKNIYKLINYSFEFNINEQEKFWNILLAHNNLNKLTNFKEFLCNIVAFAKIIAVKQKTCMKVSNEFFRNILKCIKNVFIHEFNENNFIEFFQLFDFPYFYSDNVYNIFTIIQIKIQTGNFSKTFPQLFSLLIDEYLKKVELYQDKIYFIENFLKLIKEFVKIERINNRSVLFDNKFTIQNLKNKLEHLLKTFKIDLEK